MKMESTRRVIDATSELVAAKAAVDEAISLGDPHVLVTVSRRVVAATQEIIDASKALRDEMTAEHPEDDDDLPDDDDIDERLRVWMTEIVTKSTLLSLRLNYAIAH